MFCWKSITGLQTWNISGKNQTAVSRSCAESEIISLDASFRKERIPNLQLSDVVVVETYSHSDAEGNVTRPSGKRHPLSHSIDHMSHDMVYHVPNNIPQSFFLTRLHSPSMRHVWRTNRVDLDWPFERIHFNTSIPIRYVRTTEQLADFSEGAFTKFHGHLKTRRPSLEVSRL